MPALLRYFSDLIHFKTSNPNPIPLHGNPVLDNFVFKHAAVQTGRTFASAHSCGLRQNCWAVRERVHALPQRIRAGCDAGAERQLSRHVLCHSAFVRVATRADNPKILPILNFATAHSRGLRLCIAVLRGLQHRLCHSAFARVATIQTVA